MVRDEDHDTHTWGRLETCTSAAWIRAVHDIVQHLRMRVQRRVDEADGSFTSCGTLFVDERDDRAEDRRTQAAAIDVVLSEVFVAEKVTAVCYLITVSS